MVDPRARIVVGFDGSPASLLAVNWAVAEACLREGVIVLCHVAPGSNSGDVRDEERTAADQLLARGVRHARRRAPRVEVIPTLVSGGPARQLLSVASGATLLVVGARGAGGFAGLRLGSVSAQVARHAPGTVIVVPDLGDRADRRRRRQIVVGVDGSSGSAAALAFAFTEAAGRQAELRAVYVFDAATVQTMATLPQADLQRWHTRAADTLHELVTACAQRYPEVEVCCEVLSGAPATMLTSAAAGAEMLVLGSRGHGDLATRLLGSTSHTVLHNATCPVAIIRADRSTHQSGSRHRSHRSLVKGRS